MEIRDKIIVTVSGKEGIIIATKEIPWEKTNDVLGRKKVYAENKDFLILYKKNDNNYLGSDEVWEHEIEKI